MPTEIPATRSAPALKYLFTVLYTNGVIFQQTQEDVSAVDSKRSAFTDAIHRIKDDKFVLDEKGELVSRMHEIHRFMLQRQDEQDHTFTIDLLTGHFEVNTVPFRFHETETQYFNRRLIFSRRHYQEIIVNSNGEQTVGKDRIVYRIGWQANLANGKNVQFVMEVD